jgi:hypothetical protein
VRDNISLEMESFDEQLPAKRDPVSNPFVVVLARKFCQDDKNESNSERLTHALWIAAIGKAIEVMEEAVNIEDKRLSSLLELKACSVMLHQRPSSCTVCTTFDLEAR